MWAPRKLCPLCNLRIFVDQTAEPVPAQNVHIGYFDRHMCASGGRLLPQSPVRPVRIVMIDLLIKDRTQVPLPGGMDGDPGQAHAADVVLDEEQCVQAAQGQGVDMEEIGREDRLRLGVQERPPRPPDRRERGAGGPSAAGRGRRASAAGCAAR